MPKNQEDQTQAQACQPREKVNCDRERWIQERIQTSNKMAIALSKNTLVRADEPLLDYALWGLAEGTAYEIIYILGMEPEFVNIRKPLITKQSLTFASPLEAK